MKNLLLLLSFFLTVTGASAQEVEMADGLHANGKIFVVVAVLVTILLGLIVYLITIDRKVKSMEEKLKKK